MTDDNIERVSLGDFVDADYPKDKRAVLEQGLRAMQQLHLQRDWEYWSETLAAMTIIAEEVCSKYQLDLPTADTSKGSVFQTAFLARWQKYEARVRSNHRISSGERSQLLYLIKNPTAVDWRKGQLPHRQRKMLHPSSVISGYKAALREQSVEPKLSPKDRLIQEQDQRIESDGKLVRVLKQQIEEHEWNSNDAIGELIATLAFKIRNHSIHERVSTTERVLRALGWDDPTLDALNRIVKGRRS